MTKNAAPELNLESDMMGHLFLKGYSDSELLGLPNLRERLVLSNCYQRHLLKASPVVSNTDRTEEGRLIFAKFGQCGQHTSQRSPIRSKTIFVTRFGHQEALQFFTM